MIGWFCPFKEFDPTYCLASWSGWKTSNPDICDTWIDTWSGVPTIISIFSSQVNDSFFVRAQIKYIFYILKMCFLWWRMRIKRDKIPRLELREAEGEAS